MTLEKCIYTCRDNSYGYAVVAAGDKCYCDAHYGNLAGRKDASKKKTYNLDSTNTTVAEVNDSQCNIACNGTKGTSNPMNKICGGYNAGDGSKYFSVWNTNGLYVH